MEEAIDTHIKYIRRDLNEIKGRMKGLDSKLEDHLESHNKDKEMWSKALREEFATQQEVQPILTAWNKLQTFSVGVMVFVGASVLAFIAFGKSWIRSQIGS